MVKMKIVAICGSPRKGNTYSVLDNIKESFPDIDFKILMLKDLNFVFVSDFDIRISNFIT